MKCPTCHLKARTIDTRHYIERDMGFPWVFRRIKCGQCNGIHRTVEIPQDEYNKMFHAYMDYLKDQPDE